MDNHFSFQWELVRTKEAALLSTLLIIALSRAGNTRKQVASKLQYKYDIL